MTKYSITTEQIEALNSEYTTKDVIKIILDDVMTKKVEPHHDLSAIENAVQTLEIIRTISRANSCLLYDAHGGMGSGYCSSHGGCPLGQKGGCDLSKAIREARLAIEALEG